MKHSAKARSIAHASVSQKETDWTNSHIDTTDCTGGWADLTIPENLKNGVTKTHRCASVLNTSYQQLTEHYGAKILV